MVEKEQYLLGQASICQTDAEKPYPRLCAHRGMRTIAPQNSLAALGAAIAMGVDEIEFDLWPTKDDEIVTCHDRVLDAISNGTGAVTDHTYEELLAYDFGVEFPEEFPELRIVKFEEILRKFGGQVIMNIHIKPITFDGNYSPAHFQQIIDLIRKYHCQNHVYALLEFDDDIKRFQKLAPEIPVCIEYVRRRPTNIVERAIAIGAQKVQFVKPAVTKELIDQAHAHGIICNVYWADDPEEAEEYFEMGADTVLTNRYYPVSAGLKNRLHK